MPHHGAPGERIAYTIHDGPKGAPPLLLVHGFTASQASFMANIEGLRQRFTVITTDLLGHGDSDAPEDSALYGPAAAIARLLGLLDHLGYERALVAGHSLGGALSLRLALAAPSRVAGLIIINSSTAALTPELVEASQPRYAMLAARARTEGLGFMEESSLNPAHSRWLPDDARAAISRDFNRMTVAGFAGTAEGLTAVVNAYDQVPSLAVPTLVVIGDRDTSFVGLAPDFLERLPAALTSWVTLEGAGHAANLSSPAEFDAAVIAFATKIGYLDAAAAPSSTANRINKGLTVLGCGLIVAGVAMLASAFLIDRGGSDRPAAFEPFGSPVPTATAVNNVAGVSSAGAGETSATPTSASTVVGTATPAVGGSPAALATATATSEPPAPTATVAPAATATPVQIDTPTPAPTATPQPTATPTDEPVVTPTPVPALSPTAEPPPPAPAAFVSVAGPGTAAVGQPLLFTAAAHEAPVFGWNWSGCAEGLPNTTCTASFDAPGCYPVSVSGRFTEGDLSAVRFVAVGGATC